MREREKWSEEEETEDVRDGKKGEGKRKHGGKEEKGGGRRAKC